MPIPNPEDAQEVVFDREQAFLLYATFCGDLEKTAHALNVRPVEVLRMVDEEGWNERLKAILELKKSGRPGDIERAINRALNFVMAHKFRLFLERVLFRLTGMARSLKRIFFRVKTKTELFVNYPPEPLQTSPAQWKKRKPLRI